MALTSTSVHVVEQAPQNSCCQHLRPQGELQLPPASLGDSPKSAGRSDPSSFQIAASTLGPVVCEILCVPFKSGFSFPQPSVFPKSKPCLPSKLNILGAHLPDIRPRAQSGALILHSLGRTSAIVIILPSMGHPPGYMMSLDYTTPLPHLPISLWFFLYIFSCIRSFLLDSGLSHQ